MFTFVMAKEDGGTTKLLYDPHTSELTWEDGRSVFAPEDSLNWGQPVFAVSPETPGRKIRSPNRLKIQLGLGCNYSCSYCLQGAEIHKASATSTRDAEIFLKTLDTWLEGEPSRIEFWGGEPFLYWKKLEILVPALRKRFPKASFGTVTNGTLLTREIIDKLVEWDFSMGMSHDGPAQHVRGPDPFDDPEQKVIIDYAVERLGSRNKMSFNAVLSTASYDPDAVINWFKQRYPTMTVTFEGVVHDYEGAVNSRFTKDQLNKLMQNVTLQVIQGTALRSASVNQRFIDFENSLKQKRPSSVLTQKCGMDRPDAIAVDLLGNVMTCQNVGGQGEHKIGHVRSMEKVALTTSTHWSHKEECKSCPVLQLCKGSCMYLEGDQWAASCNAEFHYNLGILAGALYHITGLILRKIDGHMVRPAIPA